MFGFGKKAREKRAAEARAWAEDFERRYSAKKAWCEERIAQIPESDRWKYYVADEFASTATSMSGGPMPYIESIEPKRFINRTRYSGSGDCGLGMLGAGVVGYALGSMGDDN
jgi:hypothetical protein